MSSTRKEGLPLLVLAALGVVYGDIGTSPLYAFKSAFLLSGLGVSAPTVMGLVSLFFWALFLVVSIKYVLFVLRVDQNGEGGILVLSTYCGHLKTRLSKTIPIILGLAGSALLFGDGVITPAISVLSALEGLTFIMPIDSGYVTLASLALLLLLFVIQKHGSGRLGVYFGPIMLLWFGALAIMGIASVLQTPSILLALSPTYALHFLFHGGWGAFLAVGGVIMVITGAEALYADLGHFGTRPIRASWHAVVFPALALNYLGQGALLLRTPDALSNPFYSLAPEWGLIPLVILSSIATLIASQAIISGVFSLIWQGLMLNDLPRMQVVHTSFNQRGQVYVPVVNVILCILTMSAVVIFETSEGLASAYGLSVAGAMLATSILLAIVAKYDWKWPLWKLISILCPLVLLDIVFFSLTLSKFVHGAWFAFAISLGAWIIIRAWRQGTDVLDKHRAASNCGLMEGLEKHLEAFPPRLPGTAVFMTRSPDQLPKALEVHLQHNKLLHERVFFVAITTTRMPRVVSGDKYTVQEILPGIFSVCAFYGFKEVPDLHRVMHWLEEHGVLGDSKDVSFFLSRGVPVLSNKASSHTLLNKLYVFLSRNALSAHEFYKIPVNQLVELGVRYRL
ncbi:MAG: KUP/HAK/KT family potassium transporter [Proteobacteria bacterium]|nr:KUP/HAK/KT family potassium transporter [Pseudomonadota bacterium]